MSFFRRARIKTSLGPPPGGPFFLLDSRLDGVARAGNRRGVGPRGEIGATGTCRQRGCEVVNALWVSRFPSAPFSVATNRAASLPSRVEAGHRFFEVGVEVERTRGDYTVPLSVRFTHDQKVLNPVRHAAFDVAHGVVDKAMREASRPKRL